MNDQLTIFEEEPKISKKEIIEFNGSKILTVEIDGVVYVAMRNISMSLGLGWAPQAKKIQSDQRCNHMVIPIQTQSGVQEQLCIPLDRLNGWLFSINPQKVKEDLKAKVIHYQDECFKALYEYWNKHEFSVANPPLLPDFNDPVAAARAWADAKESELKTQLKLKEAQPKIEFHDQVGDATGLHSMAQTAKLLNLGIGRNNLMKKLRHALILRKNNEPYQKYVDSGYFEVKENVCGKPGEKFTIVQTLVTPKGLIWLQKVVR